MSFQTTFVANVVWIVNNSTRVVRIDDIEFISLKRECAWMSLEHYVNRLSEDQALRGGTIGMLSRVAVTFEGENEQFNAIVVL